MTGQTAGFRTSTRCRHRNIRSHINVSLPYIVLAPWPRISLILLTERQDALVEYNV